LRAWVERAQRRAGLEVTGNLHILRHTLCPHLAMKGAPAKAIQELAGHAHPDDDASLHAPVAERSGSGDRAAQRSKK
jgi:integrase